MLFAGSFFISGGFIYQQIYLLGLTHYAKNILTAEELRTISRFAQGHLSQGDHLSAFDFVYRDDSRQRLWSEFASKTQIEKLGPEVTIPAPGKTEMEWGSALVGHQAIIIYSNTNEISVPDDVFAGPCFFAPGIAAYVEKD